jgi:cytoskeletal protein CcmA (bactofilin family)
MADLRIRDIDESELDTILAEDIDFTGDLSFEKPLMIKGKFSGAVRAGGDLYIGERAEVTASLEANIVSLKGRVHGDITASSRVELFSTAAVQGDLTTPDVVMESGCVFNGTCRMTPAGKGEAT